MQQMATTTTSGRMTVHEWAAMPEDEPGELCDGVLVEEEVADLTHETAVLWLGVLLRTWVVALGGFAFASEVKYALSNIRGRKPDLGVFFPGRPALPRRGVVAIPPDIAVEIVSPGAADQRRDRIAKLADHAAFGVRFYWMLDPAAHTFEILELGADGRYVHVLGASEGKLLQVPGCAGLALDLDELWREIDRLAPESMPQA
ncbi:MAG TPA: Uma2 family endonuclease [Kofleriaceae bacterium]|jgi:Uma2 family endonuclease|nr:Uma2 family endonuclease [Kofleriaceae bacterium]